MSKGQAPQVVLSTVTSTSANLTTAKSGSSKLSAAQQKQFSKNSNASVGGTSNSLASGKMSKPLMNPSALKIGKKKMKRGR